MFLFNGAVRFSAVCDRDISWFRFVNLSCILICLFVDFFHWAVIVAFPCYIHLFGFSCKFNLVLMPPQRFSNR